jgi:GWxTD domain-containing protein
MKHSFLSLVLLAIANIATALSVDVTTYTFKAEKSYIEVYIRVDGSSIQWTQKDGKFHASATAIITLKDTTGLIIAFDKLGIKSPALDSIGDFMAMKRFYTTGDQVRLEVDVADDGDQDNHRKVEQVITIHNSTTPFLSSIVPLGTFKADDSGVGMSKNGYYMEPLPYHYVGNGRTSLEFYLEVNKEIEAPKSLYVKYYLTSIINKGDATPNAKVKKLNKGMTEPLILSLPLVSVVSGDYDLVVELMDSTKKILHRRNSYITVSNVAADIALLENYNNAVENSFVNSLDQKDLEYILRAHVPIVGQTESSLLEYLINNDVQKSRRHFIYQYWKKKSPINPEAGYKSYMDVAVAVDKKFNSNVGYGFQSDRGHIFLKHGKPTNVITVDTEVDAPPYEIWYYNKTATTNQTNVRFLFFNPSLAHNDFQLLHSTCLGERYNPSWERQLYKSVPAEIIGNSVDATQVKDNFNRNARRYFNDF